MLTARITWLNRNDIRSPPSDRWRRNWVLLVSRVQLGDIYSCFFSPDCLHFDSLCVLAQDIDAWHSEFQGRVLASWPFVYCVTWRRGCICNQPFYTFLFSLSHSVVVFFLLFCAVFDFLFSFGATASSDRLGITGNDSSPNVFIYLSWFFVSFLFGGSIE